MVQPDLTLVDATARAFTRAGTAGTHHARGMEIDAVAGLFIDATEMTGREARAK